MKKKIFIFSLIIIPIMLIICGLGTMFYIKDRDNKVSLIQNSVIIEYGENYNPGIEQLIDLEIFNYINKQKVEIKSNIENEENKEYPAVGIYEIEVIYKDKVLTQSVEVKDTVSPELNIQESIEIENGADLSSIDFNQYITKKDLSEMKNYNIDLSNVDTKKSGEYKLKVSIEDIYGNTSEKEFKIIIPEVVEKVEEVVAEKEMTNKNDTTSSKKTTTTNSSNKSSTTTSTKKESATTQSSKTESSTTSKTQSNSSSSNSNTTNNTTNNNNSSSSSGSIPDSDLKYCINGGPEHIEGNGKNEHGYYKTWDLAWEACQKYMKGLENSAHFKVADCWCGLYYFWVE